MFFKFIMDHKAQDLSLKCFYLSNIACQQYWSSEQICLELKVWMSHFLNIGSSRPKVSHKKVFLKTLQNLLKNICIAAFTLLKFHGKGQWIEKRLQHISLAFLKISQKCKSICFVERRWTAFFLSSRLDCRIFIKI